MTNLFIDTYRRKDRAPQHVPLDSVFDLSAPRSPEQVEEVTDVAALERLLPDEILRALDTLQPGHRITVLLRDLGGFSYKEIASIVGCPIGTVMSRLHYARNELKKVLRPHAEAEGFRTDNED
jgi:RNA polymerase sigma-70 factor (ECF subfamily)